MSNVQDPSSLEVAMRIADREIGKHSLIGKTLGNRYLIEKQIGAGGMGTVYLARDTQLDRPVAIKVLNLEKLTERNSKVEAHEHLRRFEREAKATARLQHPNVVTIHDMQQSEGLFYIVMEYVAGDVTLATRLKDEGRLSIAETVRVIDGLASALVDIHEASIVHRDLKPANILFAGRDLRPMICDFGVTKLVSGDTAHGETMTRAGTIMGTPRFMSPEQLRGEATDARSDLYALGILAYQMLSGSVPFDGSDYVKVFQAHAACKSRPVPLIERQPDVTEALNALVMKLLEPDPRNRFQTASDVREALASLNRPVKAASSSSTSGKGLLAVLGVSVLVLAAIGILAWDKGITKADAGQAVGNVVASIESMVKTSRALPGPTEEPVAAETEEPKPIPAIAAMPIVGIKPTLQSIKSLYDQSQYARATEEAKTFVKANPANANAWYLLGMSQSYLPGAEADSRQAFKTFLRYESSTKRSRFVRGLLNK